MNTFKKIRNAFLAATALILGAGSLTSCDDDNRLAIKLNGEWYGDFGMYFTGVDRRTGITVTWECMDTYMNFNSTIMYSSYGYCKQVDEYPFRTTGWYLDSYGNKRVWNEACPYKYVYHYVKWNIHNGLINFHYRGESEWDTSIYDYSLSNHYFSGYFSDTGAPFRLESVYQEDGWWEPYSTSVYYDYYTRAASSDNEKRADGFTLCTTEQGNTLVDNPENPSIAVVLREGVDPSSIDLSTMKVGNRYSMRNVTGVK